MTVPAALPRSGTGSALLLTLTVLVLISAWPDRPDAANTAWYTLAPVRATALVVWAWLLGLTADGPGPVAPMRAALGRLTLGAVLTAPLEALAFVAGAPDALLAWSLAAPLLLAWSSLGLARGLALLAARTRTAAVLPLSAAAAAAGLVLLDLRLGLGWWTPWVVPLAPSLGAAVVLALAAALVAAWAWRTERGGDPAENRA